MSDEEYRKICRHHAIVMRGESQDYDVDTYRDNQDDYDD